jgi:Uma2 family endonuclease
MQHEEVRSMNTSPSPVTAAQLMAMGEDAPFELIRGELRRVPPTDAGHWLVSGAFATEFALYVHSGHPGRVLVGEGGFLAEQNPDSVVAPDVAFMHADRVRQIQNRRKYSVIPPDVAVEVMSPSNTRKEIAEKVKLYLDNGVRLVWVADPLRMTITSYTADTGVRIYHLGDHLDGGDVLPGFLVPVATFFE